MDALFPPDRSLLFPQFETYRLQPLDPDDDVLSFPLPGTGATQSRVGYNTHLLSFSEVQSRIEWNHLAVGPSGRGMYVDADWNVVMLQLNGDLHPSFSKLCTLPAPRVTGKAQQPEYPSSVELDPEHWAVADGAGTLYILAIQQQVDALSGSIVSTHLPQPHQPDTGSNGEPSTRTEVPFLIQSVRRDQTGKARRLILSFAHPVEKQKGSTSSSTTFELGTYSMDNVFGKVAGPSHSYFGSDLPVLVDSSAGEQDSWVVLSSKEFVSPQSWDQTRCQEEERKERERLAGGSKAGLGARDEPMSSSTDTGESSNANAGATIEEIDEPSRDDDAPYSWTQTDETLSLRIPFHSNTPRTALDITMDPSSLDLACRSSETHSEMLNSFLERRKRKWWGDIDPSESTFTYDPKTGALDFEIVKKDTKIRWPSVFSSEDEEDEDPYAEIPETFDSATLAAVRESFGRIKRRDSAEPEGNHPAIPALLREEMDYDLEDNEDYDEAGGMFGETTGGHKVGREVQIGTLVDGVGKWSKSSSTVLSLPLSGRTEDGIIVKSAVDGLLFRPSADPSNTPWKHVSTAPALSFVLSSKRDVRFVRHITTSSGTTVLAFDSGAVPGSGNVYVYYPPDDKTSAKQGVVRVSGGERGALLGVGEVVIGGKKAVMALCEKELVVLSGVLRN